MSNVAKPPPHRCACPACEDLDAVYSAGWRAIWDWEQKCPVNIKRVCHFEAPYRAAEEVKSASAALREAEERRLEAIQRRTATHPGLRDIVERIVEAGEREQDRVAPVAAGWSW